MKRGLFALAFLVIPVIAASQTQPKPSVPPSGHSAPAAPKPAVDAQLYRNTTFGFRFKVPYGWVDRTKEMREQEGAEKADATDNEAKEKPVKEKVAAQGDLLLAVFERPPDAIGETVNSAVVIASESAAAYPGLKKAEDYLGPLTELATAKGFKAEGDPEILTIDSRQLVRANFTKPLNDKLTMYQSTLALMIKGRIVSFTFIAGIEDEVAGLIENLGFTSSRTK